MNEQAARQRAESNAAAAAACNSLASTEQSVALIPKPRGSAGDGYCLIQRMGLEGDKLTYNAIVVCILQVFILLAHDYPGYCP